MTQSSLAWSLVLVCAPAGALPAGAGPRQGTPPAASQGTRHIYISALDKKGEPVTGLTAKDVTIQEDGATRDVQTAARSPEPATPSRRITVDGLERLP